MKTTKIVTLAALGLALPALAELQSANIVGYQTIPLSDNNYTMVYIPFVHVNNDGKGLMLNGGDITISNLTGSDMSENLADRIWIWDRVSGYDQFFYYDDGKGGDVDGWRDDWDWELFEEYQDGKYANGVAEGTAMYFLTKGKGKTITGAGAIEKEASYEIFLADNNFTMIANPYPSALNLNSDQFVLMNVTGSAASENMADRIWIWDGVSGYDQFFYYDDGKGGDVDGWRDDWDWELFEEYQGGKYANGIPSGTGFYVWTKGNGKSAVFQSPVKDNN